MIYALDPGHEHSALVVLTNDLRVHAHTDQPNAEILHVLSNDRPQPNWSQVRGSLVIEQIQSFGKPVGAEVFETCYWSGRFAEAWSRTGHPVHRLPRTTIKRAICCATNVNDAIVRQALIDRYGPGREKAIGTKKHPGPLYGITGHCWAALAVGVAWHMLSVTRHPQALASELA